MKKLIYLIVLQLIVVRAIAQPNDDCGSAINLGVANNGFGLGTFSQTTVGLPNAGIQTANGETFRAGFQNTDRSVWYMFTIGASRNVTMSLSSTGASTFSSLISIAVYAQGSCSPFPNASTLNRILSSDESITNKTQNCLPAGTYYIQVGANNSFTDEAVITFDVAPATGNVSYDFGAGAYDFGQVDSLEQSIDYIVECQSIDSTGEQNCPALTAAGQNTADYTKSTWHTFTTDGAVDYIGVFLESAGAPALTSAVVGYWLYEGNVKTGGPLTLIDGCGVLNYPSSNSKEYICELEPNTTYTIKLLFDQSLAADIKLAIRQLGSGTTVAPVPLIASMGSNARGTVTPTAGGNVITINDHFACNALLTDPANTCGAVNPLNNVNGTYDLTTWVSFRLDEFANVGISANQPAPFDCSDVFIRFFADSITDNCNDLSLSSIIRSGNNSVSYTCLPPGPYSIQFLGRSQIPNNVLDNCASNFGRPLDIKLTVTQTSITQFGLQTANRFDNLGTLAPNNTIPSTTDVFGCDSTVRPQGAPAACNPTMTQTLYRQLTIGANPGVLTITNLKTEDPVLVPTGITYQFFQGDASTLATANNTFTYATPLTGLTDYSGCVNYSNLNAIVGNEAKFCVTQGTYTLASYGDTGTIGLTDRPVFNFRNVTTIHNSPANAENLGTISSNNPIVNSGIDYFSCEDNAVTIDGQVPCAGATKAIYREFFLADSAILRIGAALGSFGSLSLFRGQASTGGIAGLTTINNINTDFICTFRSDPFSCDSLPPGWYTIVTYGAGPNYTNFPYPDLNGGEVGDSNRIFVEVIIDSVSRYNRPHKACNAGALDWGPNNNTADYPENDNRYTLCTEVFGCRLDLPFSGHPIDPCSANENRTAYYVFSITKPSFIIIEGIPLSINSKVYPFDVRADSARMVIDPPVQPCVAEDGYIQLCNLQPGTYSLVLLVTDINLKDTVTPVVYVDSVGISKFDHASRSYDFGILTGDNQWYNGQANLASTTGIAPSNDFFFCSTGAQPTDPNSMNCSFQSNINWEANPRVYPFTTDYHQFQNGDVMKQPRRNLWYTFVVDDIGRVDVRVDNKTPNKTDPYPFAIYKSDANGSIPFAQLVTAGGVDSTLGSTGLRLVAKNEAVDSFFNCVYNKSVSFANCGARDTVRYYLIVDNPTTMYPNSQLEVSIRYDSVPVRYDHCYTANEINGLNQISPPYTVVAPLGYDTVLGDPASFMCATTDVGDFTFGTCNGQPYEHTLWYKIEVGVSGRIKLALEIEDQLGRVFNVDDILLLMDIDTTNNNCSANGLQILPLTLTNQGTDTYGQSCISPGTYYIFLTGCSYFFERVTPVVILEQDQGDVCSNPIATAINNVGSTSASAIINCHTMGNDYGEDGSDVICLDGPAGFKSTWFRVDVTGNNKYDLGFNLVGNVPIGPVLYRVLYGSCGNMSVDISSCSSLGNGFTLECLTEGSYYVQVFSPIAAIGEITLDVTSTINTNPTCSPVKPRFGWVDSCSTDSTKFLNLSAGPNLTFAWDFDDRNITSTLVSPRHQFPASVDTQHYQVKLTATDTINNTDSTVERTVIIYPDMRDILGNDTILCQGETITLSPYLSGQFLWQDGSISPTFTVSAAGIYTATDSVGCSDTIQVFYQGLPVPQLTDVSACAGDSTVLNAGNVGAAFQWSTSQTSQSITATAPGTYIVTITNSFGCTIIDSSTITQNALPNVNAGADLVICNTSSGSLTATGADSYVWSTNAFTPDISVSPVASTNYVVTGTDAIGCSNKDTVIVTVLDTNLLNISNTICPSDSVFLAGTWQFAAGQYIDLYTNANGCDSTIITQLTVLPISSFTVDTTICLGSSVLAAGAAQTAPGTYYDTLIGSNGCDSVVTTIISVDTLVSWGVVATPDTICFGLNTTLVASGGNNYIWSTGATGSSIQVAPATSTLYWVDVALGACTKRDTVYIVVNQLPLISITGDSIICPEDSVTLLASAGEGYQWSGGDTTQGINVSTPGSYQVSVTDINGCIGTAQFTLNHFPQVVAVATLTTPTCFESANGAISLSMVSGVAPFTYSWQNGDNTASIDGLVAGDYGVTITDANGCVQAQLIALAEPEKVSIATYMASDITCTGYRDGVIKMEAIGGMGNYVYSIDSGKLFSPFSTFEGLEEGDYYLYVKDQNGCSDSVIQAIQIVEPEPISVVAAPDSSAIIFGQSIEISTTMSSNSVSPFNYNWVPSSGLDCDNCSNPIATPLAPITYIVEVTDNIGCIAQDKVYVFVDVTRRIFYVPNAFTPNDDGVNDEFMVYALGVKDISIKIFDRWGELVFATDNINQGWDGTHKGQLLVPQVFVYMVEITFLDGYEKIEKGSLILLK